MGGMFGEDVRFDADIYLVRWHGKAIPFLSKKESTLSFARIAQFNKSRWNKDRSGQIPITEFEISHVGFNLKEFTHGPRGQILYDNYFDNDEYHGYSFNDENEYNMVIEFIKEAIPVLRFDDYRLPNPQPSICVNVHLEDDDSSNVTNLFKKIESVVNHLTSEVKQSDDFFDFLAEANALDPLPLEKITKWLMDIERVIFQFSRDSYPVPLWSNQNLIEVLRKSYAAYYSADYPSFEVFLISIISLIRDRYFARVIFEKYS